MSIILSDDINDNRGEDLHKRVDTIYDYIAYMKEQLEFWGKNRTRDITNADGLIATNTASIEENADDITALSGRVDDNADDITALSGRVDDNADGITALGNRVTSLEALGYETGTSGNWTYRKWANGDYECWYRSEGITVDVTAAWQGEYYGSIAGVDFPVTFVSLSSVNQTVEVDDGGETTSFYPCTLSRTAGAILYRPNSKSGITATYNIAAKGKWK